MLYQHTYKASCHSLLRFGPVKKFKSQSWLFLIRRPTTPNDKSRENFSIGVKNPDKAFSVHSEPIMHSIPPDGKERYGEVDTEAKYTTPIITTSATLSPYMHLPSEILAEVFAHTMDSECVGLPPSPTDSPWILLRVCSRWREVALGEHRLWSHVSVKDGPNYSARDAILTWLLPVWKELHDFPLSLDLKTNDPHLNLYNLLSSFSHRLSSLSLDTNLTILFTTFFSHSGAFDNLESLKLSNRAKSEEPNVPLALFPDFPALRKVAMIGTGSFIRFIFQRVRLSQITHLALKTGLAYTDLKPVLQECTSLISLDLTSRSLDPFADSTFTLSPIELHLQYLQSFTVRIEGIPHGLDILGYFRLPAMTKLTLADDSWMKMRPWNPRGFSFFTNMIHLSQCRLTSLSLDLGCSQPIPFEVLLSDLPYLTKLIVSILTTPVPSIIFDRMIRGELLRNLEHLRCYTTSPISFLRLLEYQYTYLSSSQNGGLSFAQVVYKRPTATDEVEKFEALYNRLTPMIAVGGKQVELVECNDL